MRAIIILWSIMSLILLSGCASHNRVKPDGQPFTYQEATKECYEENVRTYRAKAFYPKYLIPFAGGYLLERDRVREIRKRDGDFDQCMKEKGFKVEGGYQGLKKDGSYQ